MLQQCSLENVPGWARAEFMAMGCLSPKKWLVNSTSIPFTPVYGLTLSEEVQAPPQPGGGRWLFEATMILSEPTESSSVIFHEDNLGFPLSYRDEYTVSEPAFAFVARLTLQRPIPQDRLLNPTPYPMVRIESSTPTVFERQYEHKWESSDGWTYEREDVRYVRHHSFQTFMDGLVSGQMLYSMFQDPSLGLPTDFMPPSVMQFAERLGELTRIERKYHYVSAYPGNEVDEYGVVPLDPSAPQTWEPSIFGEYAYFEHTEVIPEILSKLGSFETNLNKCLISLIKRLHSGPVDIGIMLAELKSTSGMVLTRLNQLVKALGAVRKRDPKALGKALGTPRRGKSRRKPRNDPGSLFLEYNFGWKQLYNDLNGLVQAIFDQMYESGQLIHVTTYYLSDDRLGNRITGRPPEGGRTLGWLERYLPSQGVRVLKGSDEVLIGDHPYRVQLDISHFQPLNVMNAVRLTANYKVHDAELKTLQSLGIANPLVAAWDYVPYSFIADWVLNLDAILKAATYDMGLTALPSTVTSFWYVPTVAFVHGSGDPTPNHQWISHPTTVGTTLFSMRSPVDVSDVTGELSIGRIIATASAPTRLFQMSTLSALAVQKLLK